MKVVRNKGIIHYYTFKNQHGLFLHYCHNMHGKRNYDTTINRIRYYVFMKRKSFYDHKRTSAYIFISSLLSEANQVKKEIQHKLLPNKIEITYLSSEGIEVILTQ